MPTSLIELRHRQVHRGLLRVIAFGGLCVLQGSYWLLPDSGSTCLARLSVSGLIYLLLGLVAVAYPRLRSGNWRFAGTWVPLGASSLMLVAVPEIILDFALRSISATTATAALALVPVMVSLTSQSGGSGGRTLTPTLAAAGGLWLLLPAQLELSLSAGISALALLAAVASIGLASVSLHRLAQGCPMSELIEAGGVWNGALLLMAHLLERGGGSAIWSASIRGSLDGLGLLLLLWLTREMRPVRLSTRFLFVPFVTVLEGAALMRPNLTLRMIAGLFLVVGGGLFVFLRDGEESATSLALS